MADVVNQLRDITAYLAGEELSGQLDEFHPPQLTTMIDWYRGGGMDIPIPLDMGMDPLVSRLIVNGYQPVMTKEWGLANINATPLTVYAGLENTDGTVAQLIYEMRGRVAANNMERARGRGEVPRVMIQMGLTYYKVTHSEETEPLVEIDAFAMVRKIAGVDRLAALRSVLGL